MKIRTVLLLPTAALAVSLVLCSSAQALYDPLASGSTTIALARPFASLLASHGVKIEAKGGATRKGSRIVLPASGGEFDPGLGAGTVESEGTLVLAAGKRKVILRKLLFKAKRSPLYAKVGGGQLKIATASRLRAKRDGFGERFAAAGLRLTAKLASRLNKKLRLGKALSSGQPLGSLAARAIPATVHLAQQGRLSLAVDPAFAAKLNGLFVSLNPIAPAELSSGPTLSFPVGPESTLAPDGTGGTVKLEGAAELLQLGSAQVFWREAWLEPGIASLLVEVDLQPSPPHSGRRPQGPLLALPPAAAGSDPAARTISISGQGATLTEAAATELNEAFAEGRPSFNAGEVVGTISLAATAE